MKTCANFSEVRQAQKDGAVKIIYGDFETIAYFPGDNIPEIGRETIESVRISKVAEIDAYAKNLRDSIVASISPAEMASWPIKREEALAYRQFGMDVVCPMLALEAATRGVSLDTLVNMVISKADTLMTLEAAISGTAGKHCDTVRAMIEIQAVKDYDFSDGWPA